MSDAHGRLQSMAPTPTRILTFERQHPAKHERIRNELGITEIRYYVLLDRAARSDEGMRAEPIVARLVRERAEKRAAVRARRTHVA